MSRVLSVAEKPSVAKELARIMNNGDSNLARRQGRSKFNRIYTIKNCPFMNRQVEMTMTSVTGHLMGLEFPKEYSSWTSVDPIVLFDCPVKKNVNPDNEDIRKTLIEEAKRCDTLLLWLDCDLEGENICFEVIDVCCQANPRLNVYRARFSALIPRDIFRTLNNPERPNKRLSDAVEARQEIDLRLGAIFTRFQTLRLQHKVPGRGGKGSTISYGPCQFPTLGYVVDRYSKIQSFVPEAFWAIRCFYDFQDPDNMTGLSSCEFDWERGRLYDHFTCTVLYESCFDDGGKATVTNIDARPTTRFKPVPMNTVELQKRASRWLSMSSDKTMKIAEDLYQRGILSYPRTETDFFQEGFDLAGYIREQTRHSKWGQYSSSLLENDKFEWPKNGGHDDKAHPPIHPTSCVEDADLKSDDERKLYALVTRHFLACCSKDAKGSQTTIEISIPCGGEKFTTKGIMILERNWYDIYTYERWTAKKIPTMQIGEVFMPKSLMMSSGTTEPPSLINESDLIAAMDSGGIGTDATIATHIKTIQDRNYANKNANSLFQPTDLGLALYEAYNNMGYKLTKPHLRASMEADCKRIGRGEVSKDDVIRNCLNEMKECFKVIKREAHLLDEAIDKYFGPNANANANEMPENGFNIYNNMHNINFNDRGSNINIENFETSEDSLSACGICNRKMSLKIEINNSENKRRVAHCETCQAVHLLPGKGALKAHPLRCDICNFQVLIVKNSDSQKEHTICPKCFKSPPGPPDSDLETAELRCFQCYREKCPLSGGIKGDKINVAPCNDESCLGYRRLKRNKEKNYYYFACSNKDCKGKMWYAPSYFKSIIPDEHDLCIDCTKRINSEVRKSHVIVDQSIISAGWVLKPTICMICDDIFPCTQERPMPCITKPVIQRMQAENRPVLPSSNSNSESTSNSVKSYFLSSKATAPSGSTSTVSGVSQLNRQPLAASVPLSNYGAAVAGVLPVKAVTNTSYTSSNKNTYNSAPAGSGGTSYSYQNNSGYSNGMSNNNIAGSITLMCKCNQPAKTFTTRKEGPNFGRVGYNCGTSSSCGFFKWADEVSESSEIGDGGGAAGAYGNTSSYSSNNSNSNSNSSYNNSSYNNNSYSSSSFSSGQGSSYNSNNNSNSVSVPTCGCNQPAKEFVTKKEGPNFGRVGYNCSSRKCNFLAWADELTKNGAAMGGGGAGYGHSSNNYGNSSSYSGNNSASYINSSSSSSINNNSNSGTAPMCKCNQPAKSFVTKKEGPNFGRVGYNCGIKACDFFLWAD